VKTVLVDELNLIKAQKLEEKINQISFTNNDENQLSFALVDGDNIVGVIDYKYCLNECDILFFCIDLKYRGKGLSKELFYNSLEYLKDKKINSIFLEVNEKNIIAYNLYKKLGFIEITVRKNYYSDKSTAIVMKKEIC